MSGNQEMFQAFQDFAATMRRVQMGNAIAEAQKKVEAIRSNQEMNEFEQIKAQQAVASMTASSILSGGGDAAMAQQARLALSPEIPDQQFQALQGTGKATIAEARKQLQMDALKQEKDMLKYKNDLEMEKQRAHDAALKDLAGIKNQPKPKGFAQAELKDMRKAADVGEALSSAIDAADSLGPGAVITPQFLSRDKRTFNILKANAQDIITRLRTGAALNKNEEAFYASLTGSGMGGEITPERLKETLSLMRGQFYNEYKNAIDLAHARGDVETDTAVSMAAQGMRKFGQRDAKANLEYIKQLRGLGAAPPGVDMAPSAQNSQGIKVGTGAGIPAAPAPAGSRPLTDFIK